MINATTRQLEADLAQLVNNAALPACIIRLVLERATAQVVAIEQDCVAREQAQAEQAKTDEKDEDKDE